MRYHRCSKCNQMAVWLYIPDRKGRVFFCDEHVPRGCVCNVNNIEKDGLPSPKEEVIWWNKNETIFSNKNSHTVQNKDSFYYEYLVNGKREPCCEYDYSEDGFEHEDNMFYVNKVVILQSFKKYVIKHKLTGTRFAQELQMYLNTLSDNIEYTLFMSNVREIFNKYVFKMDNIMSIHNVGNMINFYNSFRSILYERKEYQPPIFKD